LRCVDLLDVGIVGVELRLLRLGRLLLGIRLVGVAALAYRLENPSGVPLGELDLLGDFGFQWAELVEQIEEGGGGVECVGRRSEYAPSTQRGKKISQLVSHTW
jgi:hypothetical protein